MRLFSVRPKTAEEIEGYISVYKEGMPVTDGGIAVIPSSRTPWLGDPFPVTRVFSLSRSVKGELARLSSREHRIGSVRTPYLLESSRLGTCDYGNFYIDPLERPNLSENEICVAGVAQSLFNLVNGIDNTVADLRVEEHAADTRRGIDELAGNMDELVNKLAGKQEE
jgi:hypothetical protein